MSILCDKATLYPYTILIKKFDDTFFFEMDASVFHEDLTHC
jgi:hypothetical protein